MTAESGVLDVTDATFQSAVLEESRQRPVIVDFWAPWCGPCRVLGPIIEQVAAEYGDNVLLAKLNTDENPQTAMQYGIQGIPAVKAFRNGDVADEFVGALPEPKVREFFSRVVQSGGEPASDSTVDRASAALDAGDLVTAEGLFREALEEDPREVDALVGLAVIHLERGEREAADELLERAGPHLQARVLRHHIFLHDFQEKYDADEIAREAQENPKDARARYRHGLMLAAEERYEEAFDELLESVRLDRKFADEAARRAVLAVCDIVGPETELARENQRRLSLILF